MISIITSLRERPSWESPLDIASSSDGAVDSMD
jgi:hypothetical protein